jgi:transcriptional regulator with PAS, ATPase and Fis domain
MFELEWKGGSPGPALAQALKGLGVAIVSAGAVRVVQTKSAAVPTAPNGPAPWLWVSAAKVPEQAALEAIDRGAYDVVSLAEKGAEARVLARLRELFSVEPLLKPPNDFIAESESARGLLKKLYQAAQTSMPVLLTGETGTGKDLAARLIHQWSTRAKRAFVPINCAAIPNELMEGELFGYAKGAFSGAVRDYDGLMMAAEGGTVFLDEIDDTPHALQVKLLRVLEDRVVSRLGESVWHKVDFRILAATNRDLRVMIAAGVFGADVYERLATVSIELPPLRERIEDLGPLVQQLVRKFYAEDTGNPRARVQTVTREAKAALTAYPWPGNIRELRNVIYGALVAKRAGEELLASDLPRRLLRKEPSAAVPSVCNLAEVARRVADGTMNLKVELEALERAALSEALRRSGGNSAEAARLLGEVGRGKARDPGGTVRTMIKRLGIAAS